MALDSLDRKLLRALQANANQTHAELGRARSLVAVFGAAASRRAEAQRTIRSEVALLDPKVLGAGILV